MTHEGDIKTTERAVVGLSIHARREIKRLSSMPNKGRFFDNLMRRKRIEHLKSKLDKVATYCADFDGTTVIEDFYDRFGSGSP